MRFLVRFDIFGTVGASTNVLGLWAALSRWRYLRQHPEASNVRLEWVGP